MCAVTVLNFPKWITATTIDHMHALNHTTHAIWRVSEEGESRIRERMKAAKKPRGKAIYRAAVKGDTWTFFETLDDAMDFKVLLVLDGAQG